MRVKLQVQKRKGKYNHHKTRFTYYQGSHNIPVREIKEYYDEIEFSFNPNLTSIEKEMVLNKWADKKIYITK